MTDINDLWTRIDQAKRSLGVADQSQIKQIEDLNQRIKAVKAGLSSRYRELEAHRDEVSKLRRENEQLRQMMHRLLLAIEERYSGRLRGILQDLETQLTGLVSLAGDQAAAPSSPPARAAEAPGPADTADAAAAGPHDEPPAAPDAADRGVSPAKDADDTASAPAVDPPSDSDSRWLHEIMERARELTGERARANKVAALNPPSRSAVA